MKAKLTVDDERTGAGDFVVRGVDESGRNSFCRASPFGDDALASAKAYVRDDLYHQARRELLERIAAVKDEIAEAAKVWCDGGGALSASCTLAVGVKKLRAVELAFVELGPLPSSQPVNQQEGDRDGT